jgi:hypothetical protein
MFTAQIYQFDIRYHYKKVLIVGFLIFALVVFLEMWSVNRLSSYGAKLSQLTQTETSLRLENTILEDELAKRSALSNVSPMANQFGFRDNPVSDYIKPDTVASNF